MKAAAIGGLIAVGMMAVALVAGPGSHSAALAAHRVQVALPPERVNMVIVPGIRLGSDGKLHDAYTPTDITTLAGQKVIVTLYNYDTARHSFTAPTLGLNQIMAPSTKSGVPVVTTFSFTVRKPGSYHWLCVMPCDDAKGWAMLHDDYMAGTITIVRA